MCRSTVSRIACAILIAAISLVMNVVQKIHVIKVVIVARITTIA